VPEVSKVPEVRRRSTLDTIDNGLLVVAVVVVALLALKVVGFIVGTVWFLGKLAILAGLIYVIARTVLRRR